MAKADEEAERLVKEGEDRAREESKALLDKALADAAEARRRGEEAAEREREKARQALAGDIAALAAEVAGKLVGRAASAEDARAADVSGARAGGRPCPIGAAPGRALSFSRPRIARAGPP